MSSYQGKKEAVKDRIQILELDVEALAGPKGKHGPDRVAYRHGIEKTKVGLGGEKRQVDKPRVRSKDGVKLPNEC